MKGRCLVCNNLGRLSRDHIPPQSVVPPQHVDVKRLIALWEGDSHHVPPRHGFRSVALPTLCVECNSKRLGSEYDPALGGFVNSVSTWVRSAFKLYLTLPNSFIVNLQPHRVARAVVGHLLAAEERKDSTAPLRHAPLPDDMRRYFLDPEIVAPSTLEMFVWPYAGDAQIITGPISVSNMGARDSVLGRVLKFFPLAFWLVYERPETTHVHLPSLDIHTESGLDFHSSITLPLRGVPRSDFPETPSSDEFVLLNNESTFFVTPRRRNLP
jgi:hypothetical protein